MKLNNFSVTAMSNQEMIRTRGGFFFLIPLLTPLIVNTVAAAVLLSPLAGSAVKGWNEYK